MRFEPSGSCLRSIPTEKFSLPAPRITTARTPASASTRATSASSASMNSRLIRLRGASLMLKISTAPSRSTSSGGTETFGVSAMTDYL
jgi:hypothetical protein